MNSNEPILDSYTKDQIKIMMKTNNCKTKKELEQYLLDQRIKNSENDDNPISINGLTEEETEKELRKLSQKEKKVQHRYNKLKKTREIDKDFFKVRALYDLSEALDLFKIQLRKLGLIKGGIPDQTTMKSFEIQMRSVKSFIESLQVERSQDEKFDFQRYEVAFLFGFLLRALKTTLESHLDKKKVEDILMDYTRSLKGWEDKVYQEMKNQKEKENIKLLEKQK